MATSPASISPGQQASAPFSMRSALVPLTAIIVGIFMVILDSTAVNVALPSLVKDFHSNLQTLQWAITGYTLAQAAVIPLAGWLSDRFGAKTVFLTSIALFTIGSALCATAQGSTMLIGFRILQGMGGGFVLPVAMAYVYRLAPPERVGAVMGMMGVPILLAPAIGPVVAGWLVQYAVWRWIFLVNVPIGIVGVLIGITGLPSVQRQAVAALDRWGVVLAPLAFAALSYGVSSGSTSWTSYNTIGGIVVGAVAFVLFVAVELRSANPLLELRVFKAIEFNLAIVAQWVAQFGLFGSLFLIPLFLQQVRGFGAFDTGLILLPQALAAAVFMPIGGLLFDRIGARPLVVVGLGLVAVATYLLSQVSVTTQGSDLILPLVLTGAGMGMMLMALNTHLINAAPRALVSRVTSLTNAFQMVVNSLAVATLATILTSRAGFHISAARAAVMAGQAHRARATAPAPHDVVVHLQHQLLAAINSAFATAFDDTFRIMVVAAIIGAAMGLTLRRRRTVQNVAEVEAPDAGEAVA